MTTFDPTKPVKLRGYDYSVRILQGVEVKGSRPIVAAIDRGEKEDVITYTREGQYNAECESSWDLINIPVRHKRWINVYLNGTNGTEEICGGCLYCSREKADEVAGKRIACIEIEFEEGEGCDN